MMRSLLTSGWGIANCPCMVYAWPPAKKTGGIAGFGRYGMVGPFGGDCGEFRKGSAQGDRFLTAPAVTENRKFDTQEWRRQVTGLYGGGGGKYPVKCTRIQNPKSERLFEMLTDASDGSGGGGGDWEKWRCYYSSIEGKKRKWRELNESKERVEKEKQEKLISISNKKIVLKNH